MKILHVIPYFTPKRGGDVNVCYNLSKQLVKQDHEVTIITTDFEFNEAYAKTLEEVGIKIIFFHCIANIKLFLISPSVKKWLKNNIKNFDVIHMHNFRSYQNNIVHHYAKKYGIPYVLQAHGSLPRIMAKQRLKKLYDWVWGNKILKDASKVIALTKTEVEQYKKMGVDENKIEIVPNGIDLSEYENLPKKGEFRKKYGIKSDKKIILYLGRIHKAKGIDFLIRAYSLLVKSMNVEDVLLMITGPDDGYLSEVESLINSLRIREKVIFTGLVEEDLKTMAFVDCTMVVNVEPHNVFGLVPLEAAACSKPVIVSKGNAISEVISQGSFGFSVQYENVAELANAMRSILCNDDLLKKMGMRGREFVFKNFGWDSAVQRHEKVYEKVLKEKK